MARLALVLAISAVVAATLPSPGLYAAIGLGIAAVGFGCGTWRNRALPGMARVASAAAITVGIIGVSLATARVVLVLLAIDRIDRMLG
jgi:hypothetical protein